jgi:hypothetical protein
MVLRKKKAGPGSVKVLETPYSVWYWSETSSLIRCRSLNPNDHFASMEEATLYRSDNNKRSATKLAARREYTRLLDEERSAEKISSGTDA